MRMVILDPQVEQGWRAALRNPHSGPLITQRLLQDAVLVLIRNDAIARSSPVDIVQHAPSSECLDTARQILSDTALLFGLKPLLEQYDPLLYAIALSNVDAALDWLQILQADQNTDYRISVNDYEIAMHALIITRDDKGMRKVLQRVRELDSIPVTSDLFRPLIYLLTPDPWGPPSQSCDFSGINNVLREMVEIDEVQPSLSLLAFILHEYRKLGNFEKTEVEGEPIAVQIKAMLAIRGLKHVPEDERFACLTLVQWAGLKGGYSAALQEALDLVSQGYLLSAGTLDTLQNLPDSPVFDASLLVEVADSLRLIIPHMMWSLAIRRALRDGGEGGVDVALAIYQEAKRQGVVFNAAGVDPLILGLCRRHAPPTPEDVNEALEIYYDLRDAQGMEMIPEEPEERRDKYKWLPQRLRPLRSTTPDQWIYRTLLIAISRTRKVSRGTSDTMIQLLIDMRDFGVQLDSEFVQSVFARLLLATDSHGTAFNMYSYLREIGSSVLDQPAYVSILEQLANLSFDDDPLPSQAHYLDIMRDMRDSGTPMTPFVYTVLFSRYASMAASIPQRTPDTPLDELQKGYDLRQRLFQATKRLHLTLKLDASVTPNVYTMNSIMNAYNHLGAFREAWGIWEQLAHGSPPYDNVSISIIMDICGHSRNPRAADRIWHEVVHRAQQPPKEGRPVVVPTRNNWVSRIECCARVGDFQKALDTFTDMIHGGGEVLGFWVPKPNQAAADTLLKFSWSYGRSAEVEKLIKSELPELYSLLPQPDPNRPPR